MKIIDGYALAGMIKKTADKRRDSGLYILAGLVTGFVNDMPEAEAYTEAKKHVENLQKVNEDLEERIAIMSEDGWHDAEKDPPKKSGKYFVFDENEDILQLEYDECIDDERWGFWEEYFDMETLGSMGSDWKPYPLKVLYWMIMPEPPKGEET